jgi:hypothetical protein
MTLPKPRKTSRLEASPRPSRWGKRTRLTCEALETRLAPATIAWDGGPGGTGTDWLTAANWVGDVLPANNDDAVRQ